LKKKVVSVDELQVGKMYPSPIYMDNTNVLIPANTPIQQSDIDRLKEWNIKEVQMNLDYENNQKESSKQESIEERKRRLTEKLKSYREDITIIESKLKDSSKKENENFQIYTKYVNLIRDIAQILFEIKLDKVIEKNKVNSIVESLSDLTKDKKSELLNIIHNYKHKEENYLNLHSINVAVFSACIGFGMELNNFKVK